MKFSIESGFRVARKLTNVLASVKTDISSFHSIELQILS
jgi:hypothetical protein